MKNFALGLIALFVTVGSTLGSQTKPDEEAVRKIPQAFADAWAKHDGHQLAKMMADDVDFVTVGATWLHGRPDFEKYHVRLLSGRFKESPITPLQTAVRFLSSDIAVVHWSWTLTGDKNPNGSARTWRYGMMTMVAARREGTWFVVVSQNDNSFPGMPPEMQGIETPMQIPDQSGGSQPSNPKN